MHKFRLVTILTLIVYCTTFPALAGEVNMELTWDFFNKFESSSSASFQRYHLVTLDYTEGAHNLNLLYDWYDDTEGENNTHSLTPWAIGYGYQLNEEYRIEAGYWWVWDILAKERMFNEFRIRCLWGKSLSDQTNATAFIGLKTKDGVTLTYGTSLTYQVGNFELLAGVNAISALDDIVLSEGRIPLTVGTSYRFPSGTKAHAYLTYLAGKEPAAMTNPYIKPGNPYARLGLDFVIF